MADTIALDAQLLAALTQVFGEPLQITPRLQGPYVANGQDSSRAIVSCEGIILTGNSIRRGKGDRSIADRADVSSRSVEIHVAKQALPWTPKQGDLVVRLCDGQEAYRISAVFDDGLALWVLLCIEESS